VWTWIVVAVLLVAALVEGNGDPIDGGLTLLTEIARGKRLTHATYGADGVVNVSPDDLASMMGATLDEAALARMISSEQGNSDTTTKSAVALVAVNYANRTGTSVSSLLLRAKNPAHDGYFGTQRDIDQESANFNKSDRYASTALDAYEGDLEIARGVLGGTIADFTLGAIQFDNVAAFKSADDAAHTAANRIAQGRTQVFPAGVDPNLRFWA
jgi:hypothetical protein